MQRWEYFHVSCEHDLTVSDEKAALPRMSLELYLRHIGAEGWELTATLPEHDGFRLIFKKPLSENDY
jgi:hypothetical protein